jgi:hypothetical protein
MSLLLTITPGTVSPITSSDDDYSTRTTATPLFIATNAAVVTSSSNGSMENESMRMHQHPFTVSAVLIPPLNLPAVHSFTSVPSTSPAPSPKNTARKPNKHHVGISMGATGASNTAAARTGAAAAGSAAVPPARSVSGTTAALTKAKITPSKAPTLLTKSATKSNSATTAANAPYASPAATRKLKRVSLAATQPIGKVSSSTASIRVAVIARPAATVAPPDKDRTAMSASSPTSPNAAATVAVGCEIVAEGEESISEQENPLTSPGLARRASLPATLTSAAAAGASPKTVSVAKKGVLKRSPSVASAHRPSSNDAAVVSSTKRRASITLPRTVTTAGGASTTTAAPIVSTQGRARTGSNVALSVGVGGRSHPQHTRAATSAAVLLSSGSKTARPATAKVTSATSITGSSTGMAESSPRASTARSRFVTAAPSVSKSANLSTLPARTAAGASVGSSSMQRKVGSARTAPKSATGTMTASKRTGVHSAPRLTAEQQRHADILVAVAALLPAHPPVPDQFPTPPLSNSHSPSLSHSLSLSPCRSAHELSNPFSSQHQLSNSDGSFSPSHSRSRSPSIGQGGDTEEGLLDDMDLAALQLDTDMNIGTSIDLVDPSHQRSLSGSSAIPQSAEELVLEVERSILINSSPHGKTSDCLYSASPTNADSINQSFNAVEDEKPFSPVVTAIVTQHQLDLSVPPSPAGLLPPLSSPVASTHAVMPPPAELVEDEVDWDQM